MGRWRWTWTGNKTPIVVVIRADGTAVAKGTLKGRWKLVPSDVVEREYAIVWGRGSSEDDISLSSDNQSVTGNNNVTKDKISAERIN